MPKTAHALTSIARVHQQAGREGSHIWISDRLLNETFEKFLRNHPRCGSNVPGPLEARRRSRGRKATSLAHGATATSIPDFLSWDTCPPQRLSWWERMGIGEKRQREPQYQPWIKIGPPPPVPQPDKEFTELTSHRAISTSEILEERYTIFLRSVRSVSSLADIRRLMDQHDINVRGHPKQADRLFDCMLQKKSSLEELGEFLLDPSLNPPGSSNHLRFCRYLLAQPWDLAAKLDGFQTIAKTIEQGMMGIEHLRRILLTGYNPAVSHDLDWAQIVLEFIHAVSESKVLSLQELKPSVFKSVGKAARKSPFTAGTPSLLYKLNDLQGLLKMENIENVVVDTLRILAARGGSDDQNLQAFYAWPLLASVMPRAHQITKKLHLCSRESLASDNSSRADSSHDTETCSSLTAINTWYSLLHRTTTGPLEEHESSAVPFSAEWLEDWVLYAWTAYATSVNGSKDHVSHMQRSLTNSLATALSRSKFVDNGTAAAELITVVERVQMPQHVEFTKQLNLITRSLFGYSAWSNATSVQSALKAKRLEVLADTRSYQVATKLFPRLLATMCEDINHHLHRFEVLSHELVTRRKDSIIVLMRLLRHNRALKTALAHSWSDTTGTGSIIAEDATEYPVPRQARDMLVRLAMSCARSPVLHPRQAVRQIEHIMSLIHVSGAPLQKEVAHALWHAAITRQHGGSSTEQIHWVLDKMKWIMGEDFLSLASRLTSGDYYEIERILFGAEFTDVSAAGRNTTVAASTGRADSVFEQLESLVTDQHESQYLSRTLSSSTDNDVGDSPGKEFLEELTSTARTKCTSKQDLAHQLTSDSTDTAHPTIPWHKFTREYALANPQLSSHSRGTERYVFRFLPRGPFLGTSAAQAEAQTARVKYRQARKRWEAKRFLPDHADRRFAFEASARSSR